jgi:ParB family chromosome partitioning protein
VNRLLRTYRESTDKKHSLVRKADATRERLVFVTEALRSLAADENFTTLLRAENLDTLPRKLSDRIQASTAG